MSKAPSPKADALRAMREAKAETPKPAKPKPKPAKGTKR
jgi:hypothetical protein